MERLPKYRLLVFWLAAAGLAGWLYYNTGGYRELIGLVENTLQQACAVEDGRLKKLLVKVGDQVRAGQTLASLENRDIKVELEGLRRELARYEELIELEARLEKMDRLARIFDLEDRALNQAQNLARDRADLNSRRAEANGLETEINRLTRISKSGLGRSNRLGELRARCDALKEMVNSGETSIDLREERLKNAREILKSFIPDSGLSRAAAQAAVNAEALRLRIDLLEEQLYRRLIPAPCDGVVVNIYKEPGESTLAFQPVVDVAGPQARFVEAFVAESQTQTPAPGTRVKVWSPNRPQMEANGVVSFVSPQYRPLPAVLTTRTPAILARKLYIRLAPQHGLLPGERVSVEVIDDNGRQDQSALLPGFFWMTGTLNNGSESPARDITSKRISGRPRQDNKGQVSAAGPDFNIIGTQANNPNLTRAELENR